MYMTCGACVCVRRRFLMRFLRVFVLAGVRKLVSLKSKARLSATLKSRQRPGVDPRLATPTGTRGPFASLPLSCRLGREARGVFSIRFYIGTAFSFYRVARDPARPRDLNNYALGFCDVAKALLYRPKS